MGTGKEGEKEKKKGEWKERGLGGKGRKGHSEVIMGALFGVWTSSHQPVPLPKAPNGRPNDIMAPCVAVKQIF